MESPTGDSLTAADERSMMTVQHPDEAGEPRTDAGQTRPDRSLQDQAQLNDTEVQREVNAIDSGVDLRTVLQARVDRGRAEQAAALADLRAVMTDEQTLGEYGIDLNYRNS